MSNKAVNKHIIVRDRVNIYEDFAINLLYYIHKYYIDKETLNNDEDIYNHYKWCYNKVCDEFLMEGLDFRDNSELKEYYYEYYYHQFYYSKDNQDTSIKFYEKFWRSIFNINKQMNKILLSIMIEIYKIQDTSISLKSDLVKIV